VPDDDAVESVERTLEEREQRDEYQRAAEEQ
jgi:hypothetical protein